MKGLPVAYPHIVRCLQVGNFGAVEVVTGISPMGDDLEVLPPPTSLAGSLDYLHTLGSKACRWKTTTSLDFTVSRVITYAITDVLRIATRILLANIMFPVNNDEYPPRPQVYRLGGSSIVGEHSDGENEVVGQSVDGLNNCVFLQYASLCICDISVPLKFWYKYPYKRLLIRC